MSVDGAAPLRNTQHERYCIARASGMKKIESFRAAGYKNKYPAQGYGKLEKTPNVKLRIKHLMLEAKDKAIAVSTVSREEIIHSLRARRERARKGTAILAKDGSPTGKFREDFASGNKSDELLGKAIGMWIDVLKEDDDEEALKNMSKEDVEVLLESLLEQLDPNMRKNFKERMRLEGEEAGPEDTLQ